MKKLKKTKGLCNKLKMLEINAKDPLKYDSIHFQFKSHFLSTCNHCFGSKKTIIESPTIKELPLKQNEDEIIFETNSSVSLRSLQHRQSRPSILASSSADPKKKFSISNTPKVKKKPSVDSRLMRKPIPLQQKKRIINTNKSCAKDFHEKKENLFWVFRNRCGCRLNVGETQMSNNARITEYPIYKYPSITRIAVTEPLQIFMENFKTMKNQSRFIFKGDLGEGAFGQVIECLDVNRKRMPVAIKITKRQLKETDIQTRELDNLKKIHKKDPTHLNLCATLLQWFNIENRLCLVFSKYGDNLYSFMKKRKFEPLPYKIVSQIAFQLFYACMFLHDICHMIHTDLKPENILFSSPIYISKEERGSKINSLPSKLDIKIIDFGNAVTIKSTKNRISIGTKQYRALEVILGLEWDEKVDCWSVGCILYELYLGKVLFETKEENIHLAIIDKIIGPINTSLTETSKKSNLFLKNGKFDVSTVKDYDLIDCKPSIRFHFKASTIQSKMFACIIINCLQGDPKERPHFRDMLQSPIFNYIPESLKRKYRVKNVQLSKV